MTGRLKGHVEKKIEGSQIGNIINVIIKRRSILHFLKQKKKNQEALESPYHHKIRRWNISSK